jgi:hypothetical protein
MSTGYYIDDSIAVSELLSGRLEKYGIRDAQSDKSSDDARCLTGLKQRFGESRVDLMAYGRAPWS